MFEFFIEDEFVGVIQKGKSILEGGKAKRHKNAFFLNSLTNQETIWMHDLFIAYEIAWQLEMEAIAEANE